MKARVKATGHIVDVELSHYVGDVAWYITKYHDLYSKKELEFIDETQDYWTRLEHQATIAAMQGILSNPAFPKHSQEGYYKKNVVNNAYEYAHALVGKMKEEK